MREVSFGFGRPDELHSSTWKVKAARDGSFYVICREVGHAIKASFHPPRPETPRREWRVAINPGAFARIGQLDGPLLYEWAGEDGRLPGTPLREAFAVLIGRFSYALDPPSQSPKAERHRSSHLANVAWIDDAPPVDMKWQVTILVSDPGVVGSPPGTRAMGGVPVAELRTANEEQIWVMRHLSPLTQSEKAAVEAYTAHMVAELELNPGEKAVLRAQPLGGGHSGPHWFMDVGVTVGQGDRANELGTLLGV